ncbi:MAG: hypothetical protein GWP08_21540 [Nitrospiraceae bacterium]|nr:hypothetical protein [Nitrospiraceae bacterium]
MAVFASAARVAVMRVFMLDPTREYYQRQIEGATGLPIRAIQRELERFTAIELLYRRVEGNRTYYKVDVLFPLFPELRSMILKMATAVERLRGQLAVDDAVLLALFDEAEGRALAVTAAGKRMGRIDPGPFALDVLPVVAFARALAEKSESVEPFLARGVDLLGRREDVIWRRIEAAGYSVDKGKGVP